ncbi:MAG: hypothetical protein NWF07_01845 [Candidatus Bathyarchaeota archaeon]|nr:hypothetical protein [Candidatus Bathyarchaeota archaeon]
MSTKYVLCSHCHKSNPVEDTNRFEQNCIFCGQPFMVPQEKETQLVSKKVDNQRNREHEEGQPNQIESAGKTKPINKNQTKPLL